MFPCPSPRSDALVTAVVNSGTSFYSGFVIFIYLGYIADRMGKTIDKVAKEGYGLVFQVYPEAISTLPYAKFWCILFFFMLITLGLDSAVRSSFTLEPWLEITLNWMTSF